MTDEQWLPIKFGPVSNGEFLPVPHSPLLRESIRRTHALADEHARRLGISRRRFLLGASGAAGVAARAQPRKGSICSSVSQTNSVQGKIICRTWFSQADWCLERITEGRAGRFAGFEGLEGRGLEQAGSIAFGQRRAYTLFGVEGADQRVSKSDQIEGVRIDGNGFHGGQQPSTIPFGGAGSSGPGCDFVT